MQGQLNTVNGKKKMVMENNNFNITQNNDSIFIEIETDEIRLIPKLILLFLMTLSLIVPFGVLAYAINNDMQIGFGYVFSLLLFLAVFIFFLRMFLWNSCGKEFFLIENNTILFYNDYKYFKDNIKELKFSQITYGYITEETQEFNQIDDIKNVENYGQFSILIDNNELLKSNISIKIKYIKNIPMADFSNH